MNLYHSQNGLHNSRPYIHFESVYANKTAFVGGSLPYSPNLDFEFIFAKSDPIEQV